MENRRPNRDVGRSERTERILEATACLVGEGQKYPVRREELAREYADHVMGLPNETETLGSVFDRLADEERAFDSAEAAREAVLNELGARTMGVGASETREVPSTEREPETAREQHQKRTFEARGERP